MLDSSKEIMAIFYYEDFGLWRKEFPFDLKIADNQLAFIIFDAMLKSKINKKSIHIALDNAISYTDLADSVWYKTKKTFILEWLVRGTKIFIPYIENFIKQFDEVIYVYTETAKEFNFIRVNICGTSGLKYGKENIGRIPSDDGIPESICRYLSNKNNQPR